MEHIKFGIYEAYVEDNKQIKDAIESQYKNGDPSKGYRYGNHSFEYWLQWIDLTSYNNYSLAELKKLDSYRNFVIRYYQVVHPETDISGNKFEKYVKNNIEIPELWEYAALYVKKKQILTNFSRLNFEVKEVEYSESSGRIKRILITEV